MNSLTSLLKISRKKAGLIQEQVAEKLEVSVASVQNWESGRTSVSMQNIERLSRLYNIPVTSIYYALKLDGNKERKDNWPDFLFDEGTNTLAHSLCLNHSQQELFGLLYIYNAEYLKNVMLNSETLLDDLKIVPYEFIEKFGSVHFIN